MYQKVLLTSVDTLQNGKRTSVAQRKPHTALGVEVAPGFKDQRLCELELEQTVSASRIAELEKTCDELQESAKSLGAFYKQSPIAALAINRRGNIIDSNLAAVALFGFAQVRLEQLPFIYFVHGEDAPRFWAHLERCKNPNGQKVQTELRLRDKRRQELLRVQLVSVAVGGDREAFLTAIVDLSEHYRSERALSEEKEFSESIVETVSQPLAVLDAQLRIVSVNRAFTQFFGKPAEYAIGRIFDMMLNLWWSGNALRADLEKALLGGPPVENFQIDATLPDLGRRSFLLGARRLHRKDASRPLLLVGMEDITARKEAEEQMRRLNQDLENRVASRTESLKKSYEQMEAFCYSIAHDLRAPLRSMTGFSQLLSEQVGPDLSPEAKDYTGRIQQSAERMDELIRDLLSYGRLNTAPLTTSMVNLENVFQEVLAQHEKDIHDKGARIHRKGRLPLICGHPAVLHTILSNLVTNAMKFVASGVRPRIEVSAETRNDRIRVWVADNGIGIAPENHDKIFGVFQRLHGPGRYPGTGIGLAIVAKGVERMGGLVGLESEPGKGSRFWFELPTQGGGSLEAKPKTASAPDGRRVT